MITALVPWSYGQHSGRCPEHPISGNSVTEPPDPVAMAKKGTAQLPVKSGLPPKVAVTGFVVEGGSVCVTISPLIVLKPGLTDEEVAVDDDTELGDIVGAVVRLMLARALLNPAGEHPTKSGAVSLTAAHSCLLN